MAAGYFIVALIAAAIAVFSLQNSGATSVHFLVWTVNDLPLAAVALIAFGTGLVLAGLPLWMRTWRWRSRARSCESRIATLERTLAEREEALLRRDRPPVPDRRPPTSAL